MAAFDTLVASYLDEHFTESPVLATHQGWDGLDDRLPDLSADGYARRAAASDRWFVEFSAFADADLTAEEQIDRDLVLSHARGEQIMRDWQVWRRQPDGYLSAALMGVFSLFLRRLHPEPELVASAVARLDSVPALLADARTNLSAELANPVFGRRGAGQCRAAVTYSRDLLPAEVSDGPLRAQLAEAGDRAAHAYEDFLPLLDDLAENGGGEFAIGDERYSALLQDKEGLAYDRRSLRDRGQAEWERVDAEMRELARSIGSHDDWRRVLEEVSADAPETPEAMREGYERCTEEARQFLADHGLVTLPDGERCEVVASPPFQRPVLAVASYFGPPAFKPTLVGRFNVPFPPDGTPDDEVTKRLSDNSHPKMPTISVHEAYPGHHVHYVTMQTAARPIRLVLSTPYFNEGWALYVETMMREQGFFTDPRAELCHLEARLFRAARIVVDTSLHGGEMTFDEAVAFMTAKTSLTEPTARAEVARYCAWPTQAASYLTGALEIERIRARWFAENRGDLRTFHDRLAGAGSLPLALAERALFDS